jgi:5'-nucleotidase/2',3'-cyclic-nucleotide 2'-phosphodiesterase/3'-nucleotidase
MAPSGARAATAPPAATASHTNITILYTGDTQGHLRSFVYNSPKPVGGVAKRAIYFQDKRRHANMTWLTLDSGDAMGGTPLSDIFEGYLDIEAMNRLKYDAMELGVHEFDYGLDVLRQRMSEAKFPVLCANVVYADTGKPFATPYVILDRDGVRIAVFGLVTGDLAQRVAPENFAGLKVNDPLETAKTLVPQLVGKADIIVGLTHLGVNEDIRLASQFQQIDVICGGMSHSALQVPMRVARTLIVHDGQFGSTVGQLKLSFDRDGAEMNRRYFDCELVPMAGKWLENSDYLKWLDSFKDQYAERMGRIIGTSSMRMAVTKAESSETELGDYVCDALRQASGADVALLPAGTFHAGFPEGPVTLGDVYNVLPYDQYAEVLTVSGKQLKAALDDGAGQIGRPGFPQLSGLSMGIYNGKAYNVRIGDRDLDPAATYKVATSDQAAVGGSGYSSLGIVDDTRYLGRLLRTIVVKQMSSGQPIRAQLSSRVQFLAEEPLEMASAAPEPAPAPPAAEQQPVDQTPAPAASPEPPPDSGSDTQRLDRNGQPMDNNAPPVVVQDEVLTDQGSNARPPEPAPDQSQPAASDTSPLPDFTQPRSPGTLLGSSTQSQGGLDYTFSLYKKENGKYLYVLNVANNGTAPVELNFDTHERFDFVASSGGKMSWNYNNNRFYVQSPETETVQPGASGALDYRAEWDGSPNPTGDTTATIGKPLPPGSYHFEAIYQLSGTPVRLSFDATLE